MHNAGLKLWFERKYDLNYHNGERMWMGHNGAQWNVYLPTLSVYDRFSLALHIR